jgi:hypothetical protein
MDLPNLYDSKAEAVCNRKQVSPTQQEKICVTLISKLCSYNLNSTICTSTATKSVFLVFLKSTLAEHVNMFYFTT